MDSSLLLVAGMGNVSHYNINFYFLEKILKSELISVLGEKKKFQLSSSTQLYKEYHIKI